MKHKVQSKVQTHRHCENVGHNSDGFPKSELDCPMHAQAIRSVRGVPIERLIPREKGGIFHRQGYFGILANEIALARDIEARYSPNTSYRAFLVDEQRRFGESKISAKFCKDQDLKTNFSRQDSITICKNNSVSKVTEASVKSVISCLFCGQTNHTWQECNIRIAQLQGNQQKKNKIMGLTQTKIVIGEIEDNASRCKLQSMEFYLPPIFLPFLPRGSNDLILYAFGVERPLRKDDFLWLQEEVKYRREWNQVSKMAILNSKFTNLDTTFQPPPPKYRSYTNKSQMENETTIDLLKYEIGKWFDKSRTLSEQIFKVSRREHRRINSYNHNFSSLNSFIDNYSREDLLSLSHIRISSKKRPLTNWVILARLDKK